MGALYAAGGLHSTAADLARLLTACLAPDLTPLTAAISIALAPQAAISPHAQIGLAWHHAVRGSQRVIWHNGMTGGFSAIIAVSPARHAGAAALTNVGGTPPSPLDSLVLDALFQA